MTDPMVPVPLLFVDIDGTVRHGKTELGRFVNGPQDVVVFPEAKVMLQRWREAGGRVVGVSNQGGIALGYVSADDVRDAMVRTNELLRPEGGPDAFELILWCPHTPPRNDASDLTCWCRKPKPGLAMFAAVRLEELSSERRLPDRDHGFPEGHEFYPPQWAMFVGDQAEDQQCAQALGARFQWAADWRAQAYHREARS